MSLAPLLAHDMWIEPATFLPALGQIVGARLRVGQDLLGDPLPRDPALVNQFIVEDAAGRKPLVGRDGVDPAGFLRVAAPGLLVVGYFSNPSAVELAADQFNPYLKEEGLDAVAALRARRNQTGAAARETLFPLREEPGAFGIAYRKARRPAARFYARARGRAESVLHPRR